MALANLFVFKDNLAGTPGLSLGLGVYNIFGAKYQYVHISTSARGVRGRPGAVPRPRPRGDAAPRVPVRAALRQESARPPGTNANSGPHRPEPGVPGVRYLTGIAANPMPARSCPPTITSTRARSSRAKSGSWLTHSSARPSSTSPRSSDASSPPASGIERAGRLVEQQRRRVHRQRARDRGALLLAARELVRAGARARGDADALEQRARSLGRLGDRNARDVHRRLDDVLEHRAMREQVPGLEHEADAAADRQQCAVAGAVRGSRGAGRHLVAVDADRAGVGALEPVHAAEERGLAAARGSGERDDLTGADLERDAVEHDVRAKALAQAGDLDHAPPSRRSSRRASRASG